MPCYKKTQEGKNFYGHGLGKSSIYTIAELESVEFARSKLAQQMLTKITSTADIEMQKILGKGGVEEKVSQETKLVVQSVCETLVAGAFINCQRTKREKTGDGEMWYVYTNVKLDWDEGMKQAKRLLKKSLEK